MKVLCSAFLALFAVSASAATLKVMQYNAENFFDTAHDQGTEDYTYLPLAVKKSLPGLKDICGKMSTSFYVQECMTLDWSEAKFTQKVLNIAQVIKAYDPMGRGPDLIVLEEIENKNVLSKLASVGLAGLGYQYFALIEGDDTRGIDVGILSKYPIADAQHYSVMVHGQKLDTRGITGVSVKVGTKTVAVFGNHWPSQNNPSEDRVVSAQLLASLAAKAQADLVLALGDFNTLSGETPNPFSSLVGFTDAEFEARKVLTNLNPGSHFFKGNWTSLDHIFIFSSKGFQPDYKSFQIIAKPFMLERDSHSAAMVPKRFNFSNATGFSDHLPLGLEFNY